MNNKTYKTIWLTLILSAIFVSCKKKTDGEVGAQLQEDDGTFSHFVLQDEIELTLGTLTKNDSLPTAFSDLIHVGAFSDEYTGTTVAESYFQIGLVDGSPDFGTNPVCDSIILKLGFSHNTITSRIIQGDAITDNTLNINLLDEGFNVDSLLYNDDKFTYESDPIGSIVYNPVASDDGYISTHLSTDFGNDLLALSQDYSKADFLTDFNGFALTGTTTDGSIVGFDLDSDNTSLIMYYHNDSDTSDYNYDMSASYRYQVYIDNDRGSSNFAGLEDEILPSTETNNEILLQCGTGAGVYIKIGDFLSQLDTTKNIVVNKAVLSVPTITTAFEDQYNEYVPFIRLYEVKENGNFLYDEDDNDKLVLLPDATYINGTGSTLFGYDTDTDSYEFNLTYYFQEYALGEGDLNSFLISPNVIVSSTNYMARTNRSIIDAENIEFKLYYSIIE